MEQCRDCDLAIYCYTDSSSWIFRTKQEMGEKKDAIANCPLHRQVERAVASRGTQRGGGIK